MSRSAGVHTIHALRFYYFRNILNKNSILGYLTTIFNFVS